MSLVVKQLSRTYDGHPALLPISFTAQSGTILGLLGPNGAGKTTLVRLLSTVLDPTGGAFSVAGVPHTEPQRLRARIGVLPESAGLPRALTGREYLRLHASLHGRDDDVGTALLEAVGMTSAGDRPIGTYSRGMRQRIGIARALVNDPAVLLLDEPTLGLDPAGQRDVMDLVRRLVEEREVLVVYSTHFLAEVEDLCHEALILGQGRMIAHAQVAELQGAVTALRIEPGQSKPDEIWAALTTHGLAATVRDGMVIVEGGPDERAACLRALAENGLDFRRLSTAGKGLREVFLQLTEGSS